jgi:eukaryotic-like serine/threonine-protein kinase
MQAAVPHQARFGPYLIMRKLGEGAMAKVYLARRTDSRGLHQDVALKVLRREYSGKPEILSLLRREAVIGGKMRHPHVVATLEFGEIDGLPYLAMEYVQGVTVADLLEMVDDQERGLPPELTASLMVQVCDGLSYAHNLRDKEGHLGVVHRDLKPGNVMVSLSGVAKVMDFGVAKIKMYGGDITTVHRTTRGTPAYMSPEQARGDHLTHHSDVFTAGLLLYEMLTGRKPFTGENFGDLLRKVREGELTGQVEEVEEAAPGVGRVFLRATAAEPLKRYPDALWMKEDLELLYPADTPIPPPTMEDDATELDIRSPASRGVVHPPVVDGPEATRPSKQPGLAVAEQTQPSEVRPEDTIPSVASMRTLPEEDDEQTLESARAGDELPPPALPQAPDENTRYYAIEGPEEPSSPVEEETSLSAHLDDPTRYYQLPGAGNKRRGAPVLRPGRPRARGGEEDDTEYYVIDESASGVTSLSAASADPRMLATLDEEQPDGEEIDLDPETHDEVEILASAEIGDIGDIDLETLPELNLDDETIPEVDLGPPVFLELRPKPDPKVPVSTDTLVHLTQFLIEIEN